MNLVQMGINVSLCDEMDETDPDKNSNKEV